MRAGSSGGNDDQSVGLIVVRAAIQVSESANVGKADIGDKSG
ncbi:hypothetical protein ACFL6C_09255 [Myxococcota bacterium]